MPLITGMAITLGTSGRGAKMAQQIRNGFNRAWTTILDSHLTTFLSGVVLWWVGTEEIKGFALTLIIGMVWNLFTAVYFSRAVFDLWYSQGWLKKVTMLKLMDKTNIDFIGPRKACMTVSVILIVLGFIRNALGMIGSISTSNGMSSCWARSWRAISYASTPPNDTPASTYGPFGNWRRIVSMYIFASSST